MENDNQGQLPPGTILSERYQITNLIARGKTTQSYLAYDRRENNKAVLKVLIFHEMTEWKALESFENEVKTLKNISHPSIPGYIADFEADFENKKIHVLVKTYFRGENLENLIKSGRKFTLDEVLSILWKILETVEYIHTLHPPLVHRDINPGNILLGNKGNVYLLDFAASAANENSGDASADIFVGTPGYTTPEQNSGRDLRRADLYSSGVTIIFLLTGKDPVEIEMNKGRLDYKKLVDIPAYLSGFLDKMIDPEPENRFQSAGEAMKSIEMNLPAGLKQTPNETIVQPEKDKPVPEPDIDVNAKDELGLTPLLVEVRHNRYDTACLLIEKGADVNAMDTTGLSVLGYAVKNNNEKILKLLFKNNVTLNAKNPEGANVLTLAVRQNAVLMAKQLIKAGINIDNKDLSGKTALDHAVLDKNKEMIRLLIESKAKLGDIDLDNEFIKEALVNKNEDINKQDGQGRTPLMIAIDESDDGQAAVLIAKGVDLNIKDKKGLSALIHSIWHARLSIIDLLLEKGADVNAADNKGMTPLMWALQRHHTGIAKSLVGNGADVFARDKQGRTLEYYATSNKTRSLLRKAGLKIN